MTTARDFFERARAAAQDAERVRRQLDALEARARTLGAQGFEPRTRSTPDPQRMERRVVAYVDQERMLRARVDDDYDLIDRATSVCYGPDQDGRGGVAAGIGPFYADVLWWRYLDAADWRHVARAMGFSVKPCQVAASQALAWLESTRCMAEVWDV